MPFMDVVQSTVGQHTQLGVRDGHEVVFIERLQSPAAVINLTRVASRMPLSVSSSGLVLLAHAPPEVLDRVLRAGLPTPAAGSIADAGRLRATLHDVRRHGFVLTRGFVHEDAAGLAVPVHGPRGVVAALSVIVPNDEAARQHLPVVRAAGRALSRALGGGATEIETIRSSVQ
jgi:DNA-binding IclR family transcriptional regulator